MTLIYRAAEKRDCLKLAELRNIASDGIMEYLLHDLIPGMKPVQVAASDMEKDKDPHTYRNAIVAKRNEYYRNGVLLSVLLSRNHG